MRVTYFTGLRGLEPESMVVYRKNLIKELEKVVPSFKYKEYAMRPVTDLDIPHFHLDRTLNRFLFYQIAALKHYSEINHVLDQTYASGLNLLPKGVKKIVTVHDLNLLGGRLSFFRLFCVPAIKRANKVIAVSESTKKDLHNLLSIPEDKIKVIYEAVDTGVFKPNVLPKEKLKDHLKFKNKLLLLSVANHEERKNTALIVKSLPYLINLFPNLILIRVGKESDKVISLIKKMQLEKRILYFQNISERKLILFYQVADLFVFPSLKEGFGFPVLESMACGCPVICSNISSLPEVAGNAALMIGPYKVDSLERAIEEVLSNEDLRNRMIEKGFRQAKKFSWQKAAKETLKIYQGCLQKMDDK